MKIRYVEKKFSSESDKLILLCNGVISNFARQGYTLTLRQLYYQLVGKDLIENTDKSYDRLGALVSNARLAGRIDWSAIEDRTRNLARPFYSKSPESLLDSCARGFTLNRWEGQENYVEVWVEKEALANVVERAADELQVGWLACRGYMSQSEMEGAAHRFADAIQDGRQVIIVHLGDHDPSGIDMSRDIRDRLAIFLDYLADGEPVEVKRIALNRDQVDRYDLPPNPAKVTDSRAGSYIATHGRSSWELDALQPSVIHDLIVATVVQYCDLDLFAEREREEKRQRGILLGIADNFETLEQAGREEDSEESGALFMQFADAVRTAIEQAGEE